eukprot:4286082-Prymnesium_polylepis.2
MLVYMNARTWTHDPELLAPAEIREAMREGLHLQLCHEFPSVIDSGSERHALEFKQIVDATPADLKRWPTDVYCDRVAIALKGGELREPGLANLAARLAVRKIISSSKGALSTNRRSKRIIRRASKKPRLTQASSRDVNVGYVAQGSSW